jgi:insertion element IS1 protein InsB
MYYTDYWKSYTEFLPEEKHIQSKAETFTVEGKNNLLRHYIARFHRKTHCYSKSIEMVENTILLFINKEKVLSMIE